MIKLGAGAKMIPIYWAPQHLKNSTGTESYNFWHTQKKKKHLHGQLLLAYTQVKGIKILLS